MTDGEIAENQQRRERDGYAPNPFCEKCGGFGWVHPIMPDGKRVDYSQAIPCAAPDCIIEAKTEYMRTRRYLVVHGMTERLQTFEFFKPLTGTVTSYNAFYNLAHGNTDKPFLLCYGGTGNGKTHLCQALATVLNSRGIPTYYYRTCDIMSNLRQGIEDNGVEQLVTSLSAAVSLVLDDFGTEKYSDWGLEKLQNIIDARWTNKRLTVLTMNKNLTELQFISPRLFSRMCDQEISEVVQNAGKDYRVS